MESTSHKYPGVNLPLRHLAQCGKPGTDFYRLGSFDGAADSMSELLQVREVAMMILMDRLTDSPDWHEKVFDDAIVANWRSEALTQQAEEARYEEVVSDKTIPMPKRTRIITDAAFDYCIAELRCKAAHFRETGLVFTINSSGISSPHNTAIKADSLVSDEIRQGLKAAFEKLRSEQGAGPDWHPKSDDQVLDLVHPSMYPFVYEQTKFIQDEVVGVTGAVDDKWFGKGEIVPKTEPGETFDSPYLSYGKGECINRDYWSRTYQWLPANLAFQDDGTVRFTSYINNLHPKHSEIYRLVEKLVDIVIPTWERVLSSTSVDESGKAQIRFDLPPPVGENDQDTVWEKFDPDVLAAYEKDGPVEYDAEELEYLSDDEEDMEAASEDEEDLEEDGPKLARKIQRLKWRKIRDALFPEPLSFKPVTYQVGEALHQKFKDNGLQVFVKMASIELTPEKPVFPAGGWHIEGQMNEHIVATALYYLDSENVTPSRLNFRMATSYYQEELESQVNLGMWQVYEHIYGTRLGQDDSASERVQTYGSVATPEGRLLAFPNVFQHAVSPFSLQDHTRPGHRRFIGLWLVDPFQRIISTANVPPQQLDWWTEAGLRGREQEKPKGLMTVEEAREHRLALMAERSAFVARNEQEWQDSYGFCDH